MKPNSFHNIIGAVWRVLPRLVIVLALASCFPSEELDVAQKELDETQYNELDAYINEHFVEKYGMAVRYRYVDSYLGVGQRVTPVKVEMVRPMLDFLQEYWIEPFLEVENGAEFFSTHVPAEVIIFGGLIYQGGTVLLGLAEAGARITLLNVNEIDPNDQDWILFQLGTIYHEFAHVVHQRYKLPPAFDKITPTGYTGPGSWYVLDDNQALERGFVSPYGTSSVNEDFAEIVAFYLYDPDFETKFLEPEANCTDPACIRRNEGRAKLQLKLASIADHYEKVTGVNLAALRVACQSKIVN